MSISGLMTIFLYYLLPASRPYERPGVAGLVWSSGM
jgi:hypothetical protein